MISVFVGIVWASSALVPGARAASLTNVPAAEAAMTITRAGDVLKLASDSTLFNASVQIRGVVTYREPDGSFFAIQDSSGGVFAEPEDPKAIFNAGQLVEITGRAAVGEYGPVIRQTMIKVLAESSLPPAVSLSISELTTGSFDAQWVELDGVVRSAIDSREGLLIELAEGAHSVRGLVPAHAAESAGRFVDSKVTVRGVSRGLLNRKKQWVGVRVLIPNLSAITVVESPPKDPFSLPVRAIGQVGRYESEERSGRRVHVQGVVLGQEPGQAIFLKDGTGEIMVNTPQWTEVHPGDVLDVVGFQASSRRWVILDQANFRKIGVTNPPAAAAVTPEQALTGDRDFQLVRMRGRLLAQLPHNNGQRLTLKSAHVIFHVDLESGQGEPRLKELSLGSDLEVTGVCVTQADVGRANRSFRIVLRSPDDVMVLADPPWLTHERLSNGLVALGCILLAVALWVFLLRRRVAAQTREIRQQSEAQALIQRRYMELVENASDFVFMLDTEGRFTSCNHAGEKITGYSAATLSGMNFGKLVAPEFREAALKTLARTQTTGVPAELELEIVTLEGQRARLELSCQRTVRNGQPSGVQGIARDVTLRRKIEEQLKASQQRLQLHERQTPMGVIVWDMNFRVAEWNPSAERIFGYTQAEAVGTHAVFIIPPSERGRVEKVWEQLVSGHGGTRSTNENQTKDGRTIICDWYNTPLVNADGNVIGVASLVGDITERKRAEAALRQSEERFERAFQANPAAISISTLMEGKFIDVNEAFLKQRGYKRSEVVGHTVSDIDMYLNPEDRFTILQRLQQMGSLREYPLNIRIKSGEERTVSLSIDRIELDNVPCLITIAYDITDRRQLEEQLRQAQKMDAIGRLSAGIAHDFNNLLTVIMGRACLLQGRSDHAVQTLESLQEIVTASEKAANLVRQLLTFSRKQLLQPRPLDINEIILQISKMIQRLLGEDIALQFVYASEPASVYADAGMIEQVLVNLVVNARDAMPKGGRLLIQSGVVEIGETAARSRPDTKPGRYVCLTVTDSGVGMDAETMRRLFEPFFTTKEVGKGTGLGLATVYGIVKQHHGWIEVDSVLRRGTTFRVYIPYHLRSANAPIEEDTSPMVRGGSETILVAEDEPAVRDFISSTLEGYGYRILTAASGVAAMEVWRKHSTEVNLLLTDMVMPEGMSGGELAQRLHSEKPELKVICCSGYSIEMLRRGTLLRPGVHFLQKPYTPLDLARAVRQCLDGKRQASTTA